MSTCPNCKKHFEDGTKFCDVCGTPVVQDTVDVAPQADASAAVPFKITDKMIKIGVAVLAAVLVVAILISALFPVAKNNAYAYVKDDELYFSTVSKAKGEQVTTKMFDGVTSSSVGGFTRISEDGKRIFYVDKYDGAGYDLYYKKTSGLKKDGIKIASGIKSYDISENGGRVTYIKDTDKLYQHNLKEQGDKIDDEVDCFVASANGKKILYVKSEDLEYEDVHDEYDDYGYYGDSSFTENDLYLSKNGKAGEKVVSGYDELYYISDGLDYVVYTKGGALYTQKIGKDAVKVDSDVSGVIQVYDSGEIYYVVSEESEDGTEDSLYYYSGKKDPVLVSDEYGSYSSYAQEKATVAFYSISYDDSYEPDYTYYIAVKDKAFTIDYEIDSVDINLDGKTMYFIADVNEETEEGDLYSAKITSKGIDKAKKVDSDVYGGYYVGDGKYLYVKDYDSDKECGQVYFNNKKVGDDVEWDYNILYIEKTNSLLFFTDVDDENMGSLYIFKGSKATKVLDDVYVYGITLTPDSDVLFLADYSGNGATRSGTMYILKGKKAKKLDDDVTQIVSLYTRESYDLIARYRMMY